MHHILVINPGSSSTRVSAFADEAGFYATKIDHPLAEIRRYARVAEQYAMRRDAVLQAIEEAGLSNAELDAVVGRGGLLRPIPSGTYIVNQRMLDELRQPQLREHASNLGALIAHEIAVTRGIPAYVVDPVTVDEFTPLARITGLPGMERRSESHALNLKAAAREASKRLGRPYQELNLVVVHLGTGISVSAHEHGQMVDVNQGLDGTGPFSPERAGGLPVGDVMRIAFSGRYTYDEMFRLITRQGGLVAHLGTNDAREVERRIAAGDEHARLVYEAMAYQIAKEIGLMATVLKGNVQAIVVTGSLAYSTMLMAWLKERVEWIAPVLEVPGEREMLAMAQGALRVLRGEEEAKEY